MAIKHRSTIGFWLLAIALFGATPNATSFAEEVRSGAPDGSAERSGPSAASGEPAARSTSNSSAQPAAVGSGDAAKISTGQGAPGEISAGGDAEGIDTRITVQPRRSGRGRDRVGGPKAVKLGAPRNLLARRPVAPSGTEPAVRNAVGVVISRREGIEQHSGERSSIIVRNAASGALGAMDGSAKPQGSIRRPTTNANLIVRPVVVNRGAINGTSLIRPGSAPSGIGGPAKTAAGLNGTTIRPPH
jgi:hypothetical protein